MKKLNRILCFMLLMAAASVMLCTSVFAYELKEFDRNKKCELDITVLSGKDDTPVKDAQITLHRVADLTFEDKQVHYICAGDFAGYAGELEKIDGEEIADSLYRYATDKNLGGMVKTTDSEGKTSYTELEAGVYLVSEIRGKEVFAGFKPFLAVLPYDNRGSWVFKVYAEPKTGVYSDEETPGIRVVKVWNDDGKDRPESINVQLLCDGEVYDTVALSDANGWSCGWTNLPGGKTWDVKETDVPQGYHVTYSKDEKGFVINNTRDLPYTGQLKWPIPVLAAGGLALIIAGFALRPGRSSKKQEKNG
ncbi:MAG: Cna B-type domain-containing protein [Ruminococcus sp.]|nr:Cna B-type domain-containing protein [Ruminococcus sp.]